jgi:predicted MFS family arabinose efflux permease
MSAPSSRNAWPIVLIGFASLSLAFSARASIGLVMPSLEAEFGVSRSAVSGAAALGFGVMAVLSIASGWLVDRLGPARVLPAGLACLCVCLLLLSVAPSAGAVVAIYGIVGGVAFGTAAIPVVAAMVARAAGERRGLAIGLATSGSTAGQIFVIPGLAFLIALFGWRTGYAILGTIAGAFTLAVWLALNRRKGVDAPGGTSNGGTGYGFLGSFAFQALFWSYVICGFTTSGVIETHLIPFAISCGYSETSSANAYGLLSIVNFVGITFAGWLSDRVEKHGLLAAIYALRALSFLLLMHIVADYSYLLGFAVFFGLVDYATIPVTIALVAHYVGVRQMGMAMGVLAAGHSLGGGAGALLGGTMFDLLASYSATWWASAALALCAAVLVLAIRAVGPRAPAPSTAVT